jgi:hypothetical protein
MSDNIIARLAGGDGLRVVAVKSGFFEKTAHQKNMLIWKDISILLQRKQSAHKDNRYVTWFCSCWMTLI